MLLKYQAMSGQWNRRAPVKIQSEDHFLAIDPILMEDSYGFMYMGSSRGLYRYNGSTFQYFSHSPSDTNSIGPGHVFDIVEDEHGFIWVGVAGSGLYRFNPKTGSFKHFKMPGATTSAPEVASSLVFRRPNELWIGANNFRLIRLDIETNEMTLFQNKNIDTTMVSDGKRLVVGELKVDVLDDNVLWMRVLDHWESKQKKSAYGIFKYYIYENRFEAQPFGAVRFEQDKSGNIWCTHSMNTLFRYNTQTGKLDSIYKPFEINRDVQNIVYDLKFIDEKLFVNTYHGVFSQAEVNDFKFEFPLVENKYFRKMYIDRRQQFWMSAFGEVHVHSNQTPNIQCYSFDELNVDPNFASSLVYHEPLKMTIISPDGFSSEIPSLISVRDKDDHGQVIRTTIDVNGLVVDENGDLIVSGSGQLQKWGIDSSSEMSFKENIAVDIPWVWNLQRNANGWISGAGIHDVFWFHEGNFNLKTWNIYDFIFRNEEDPNITNLQGLTMGVNNKAYVFSNQIFEIDFESSKSKNLKYDIRYNKSNIQALDIEQDREDELWVTFRSCVVLFNIENDTLVPKKVYESKNGSYLTAPDESLLSKNYHWTFGQYGIHAVHRENGLSKLFNKMDGLPSLFVDPRQIIQNDDGYILTEYGHGLIRFHPDSLWSSDLSESVATVIERIMVDGKPIQSDTLSEFVSRIVLPIRHNSVDISFQAIALPTDENIVYSYRLLGQDDTWVDMEKNKNVRFSRLIPGDYDFQVKASSSESKGAIKSLKIHVPAPIYSKWYIQLIGGLLLLSLVFILTLYRIKLRHQQSVAKNQRERELMEIELKALRSQMNPHFMFNSLNSIMSYILESQPMKAAEYLSDFAHLVRMILQHSRSNLISLKDELDALLLYIDLEQLRLQNEFTFSCEIDDKINLDSIQVPPLILQPFVENAIWHGLKEKGNGHLGIKIYPNNDKFIAIIEDNGIGREASKMLQKNQFKRYKSLGVGITSERIELINRIEDLNMGIQIEDLYHEDGRAAGTRVIVSFQSKEL